MLDEWLLQPYIRAARGIVRVETDVVMRTHLLLIFATSVPSALVLGACMWIRIQQESSPILKNDSID